ncbi:MAG: hypothetical protein AAFX50_25745, partial [Acidobacteriota bacterium]
MVMLIVVNSAIWTYFDASRHRDAFHVGVGPDGRPPHTWASWVLLFIPVGLPLYVRARGAARLTEPRPGPPPRFKAGGFNFFGVAVGLVGLGIFATLIVFGRFRLASLGLVVAAAGLFGGRHAELLGEEGDDVGLGELGIEQVGFRADIEDQDGHSDKELVNVEAYFANLAAPNQGRTEPAPNPPAVPSPPAAQTPGVGPARPQTAAAPPPSPAPTVAVPSAPRAPSAPPAPGGPAPPAPGEPVEPAPGVVYSPPPAGVVYAPPAPGSPPPPAPLRPAAPAQPPPPRQPPPPQTNPRATVAVSEAA